MRVNAFLLLPFTFDITLFFSNEYKLSAHCVITNASRQRLPRSAWRKGDRVWHFPHIHKTVDKPSYDGNQTPEGKPFT